MTEGEENVPAGNGFAVDEEALREFVLKAYHEARDTSERARLGCDAVRQFLSGPPGGRTVPERYWFEENPEASIESFFDDLERTDPQLPAAVFGPLVQAVEDMEAQSASSLAPNLSVYVASLAGSCAVKAEIDEAIAAAIVCAAILGLSRLGRTPFVRALSKPPA